MNKNELKITWGENGDSYVMAAPGTPLSNAPESDFFRLMIDDGYLKEITIPSHLQKGEVSRNGNTTSIHYKELVDGTGRQFKVDFTVYAKESEEGITFSSKIDNQDDVRVNEVQLPFLDFASFCDEDKSKDVLYRCKGMGERTPEPWTALESGHTEYMSADYREIWTPLMYPRPSSMPWHGLESNGYFFYMGRHSQAYHTCVMNVGRNPRGTDSRLCFSICHFPLVQKGEVLETADVLVRIAKGDWRDGSQIYRAWAEKDWFKPRKKKAWVENFTGWQRIILRHQYGEVFWKYKDLVDVYEHGKKYGIDTINVFGWWKGRFDNGYPLYEPDDALGGEEELKKAITEVRRRGGNIILYTNGVLMDVKSDFYKEKGLDVAMIDLDGNPLNDHYQFSNQGTLLRTFGYKTFVQACNGTDAWKEQLLHNGRVKLSMKPNAIFFDQIGGHRCALCFNTNHKHGNRGDLEPFYRMENFKALNELLEDDEAIGTECTVDIYDPYMDYHHGCDYGNWYEYNAFPQLYLNTFPETILTNRRIHDERKDYKLQLNYVLFCGYRFDVCIYRGRFVDMAGCPGYAEKVKELLAFKEKYHRFFYPAHFKMEENPELPFSVQMAEYVSGDEKLYLFFNGKAEDEEISFQNKAYRVPASGIVAICGDVVEYIEG